MKKSISSFNLVTAAAVVGQYAPLFRSDEDILNGKHGHAWRASHTTK